MRGKVTSVKLMYCNTRITPAYAGKRRLSHLPEKPVWDHPRLCGEKTLTLLYTKVPIGSPPPMRGKVLGDLDGENSMGSPPPMRGKGENVTVKTWRRRITPAYAGKRDLVTVSACVDEDHPRLCGEKDNVSLISFNVLGSPPPMRGKAVLFALADIGIRITPAYAGKSPYLV